MSEFGIVKPPLNVLSAVNVLIAFFNGTLGLKYESIIAWLYRMSEFGIVNPPLKVLSAVNVLIAFLSGTLADRAKSLIDWLGRVRIPETDKSVIEVDFKVFWFVPVWLIIPVPLINRLANRVNPEELIMGSSNENTISIKWTEPGNYTIIAQFSNGRCVSSGQLNVIVEGCPDFTIYIPNTFTPDGDNTNDVFGAYGTNLEEFSMEIYDRWGELLFVSDALEYRWDGYYKGNLCQQDVYVFKITYKAKNLIPKAVYGRVLLLN